MEIRDGRRWLSVLLPSAVNFVVIALMLGALSGRYAARAARPSVTLPQMAVSFSSAPSCWLWCLPHCSRCLQCPGELGSVF